MKTEYLSIPCIVTSTPYGNKYTAAMDYRLLQNRELHLFSNKTSQRAVNQKRAHKIARDYFNTLTKGDIGEHEIPFQSSFVCSIELHEHGISEDLIYEEGHLKIPIVENIVTIRDGGHRKVAAGDLIARLYDLIDRPGTTKQRKIFHEAILNKFLSINFTVDFYINLEEKYGKRCLLDLGKSEPVSEGRSFYFVYDEFVNSIDYLISEENIPITLNLDNTRYSKYDGLAVPLSYVISIFKNIGKALAFQGVSVDEINNYIISFMKDILLNLEISTFNIGNEKMEYLNNCKVNYFTAISRLVKNEFDQMKRQIISEGIGKEDVYSKLAQSEKEIVHATSKQYNLIGKFDDIKELVLTEHFQGNIS
ncbi:hypothetical protein ORL59_25915 [Bacillus cereus]|uniref:hypothetical protein n=1 Tax=Bacillus cereus TaxID=1396 RepID=UPI002AC2C52B|nr:hypothetical protein [Bacillus cereus]MDZ4417018.1 hypothetical protein [Bacillus cereus]